MKKEKLRELVLVLFIFCHLGIKGIYAMSKSKPFKFNKSKFKTRFIKIYNFNYRYLRIEFIARKPYRIHLQLLKKKNAHSRQKIILESEDVILTEHNIWYIFPEDNSYQPQDATYCINLNRHSFNNFIDKTSQFLALQFINCDNSTMQIRGTFFITS